MNVVVVDSKDKRTNQQKVEIKREIFELYIYLYL